MSSRVRNSVCSFYSFSKPQNVFLILELVFGLLFVFITPPALVGDEPNHFFRAYQISDGHLLGEKRENLSGGWLPKSVLYTNRKLVGDIEMNSDVKFDTALIGELRRLSLNPDNQVFERFPNTVVYTPIPYIPQILGIITGRIFDVSPLDLIYFARIFNLLFFIGLAFLAIKKTPVHKWVFCLLCLTPTNVFQVASASADAFTYGICFLAIAYFLFYALDESPRLLNTDLILIFLISCFAVLSKQAYIFLPSLFLLIPIRKVGSLSKYILTFFTLSALCLISEIAWSYCVKGIYLPYRVDIPIDPQQQAAYIIRSPLIFTKLAALNYYTEFKYYFITFFGQLTWFDLYVPTYLTIFVFTVLIIIALIDKNEGKSVSIKNRFLFIAILSGTALLISVLLYMSWSPIGGDGIEGIQGRYFIPVAPLFFLVFYSKKLNRKYFNFIIPIVVYLSVIFSLVMTIHTIFKRYYF